MTIYFAAQTARNAREAKHYWDQAADTHRQAAELHRHATSINQNTASRRE